MIRHFTSTGIVAANGATLVHWHNKVQAWLAPGGHVEDNEDPVQAAIREVKEETGLDVEVVPTGQLPEISNLQQVIPPYTVMIEDVFDQAVGKHQHIDFIYFTTLRPGVYPNGDLPLVPDGWHWVGRHALAESRPLPSPSGELIVPPEDVLKLGIAAIDLVGNQANR